MHTPPLNAYVACLERGDMEGVARIMLDSAQVLARAGADFLICPDNTIHQALPKVLPRSALPWLHIAEVVAQEALANHYGKVAIAGTRWLVESDVYPHAFGKKDLQCFLPPPQERGEIHRIIMDELVNGRVEAGSIDYVKDAVQRWKGEGCTAVALVCTELPLLFTHTSCPLPVLDSTRLLARAALRRAVAWGRTSATC